MKITILIPNNNVDRFEQELESINLMESITNSKCIESNTHYEFNIDEKEWENEFLLEILIKQNKK